MPLGGCVQTTEQERQTHQDGDVGVLPHDVAQQDRECPETQQHEHEDRHPTGALDRRARNGWGVPRRGLDSPTVVVGMFVRVTVTGQSSALAGAGALRGRPAAAGLSLGRSHGQRVYAVEMAGPRVLVIDSYDSFVYNLVQYLGELGAIPIVVRNDEVTVDQALHLGPDAVLVSPGPGRPEDAGIICAAIPAFGERGTPVLGVCLGHQAIGHVYGAVVERAPHLMHGKTSHIEHEGSGVFAGLPTPLTATRYHSLVIAPTSMPTCLEVTASTADGIVMGVRHRSLPIEGVQFHPESILTAAGHHLLRNFLSSVAVS